MMRGAAEAIANDLQTKNPSIPPAQMLVEVDRIMREEMPNKFLPTGGEVDEGGERNQNTPSKRGKGKLPAFSSLTEQEQAAGTRFIKLGLMDEKEYIEQLVGVED
jgi:hypothetical protein